MPFGLTDEDYQLIKNVFSLYFKVEEVVIFGSRAMATERPGSDIDLALKGNDILLEDILSIIHKLDELPLAYKYDIIDYTTINNPALTEHINKHGILFYKKKCIPDKWKKYKLGDVIDVKHGFAFKGEYFSDKPTCDILLTPGNFKIGGGFKSDKFRYYNGDFPEDYILKEGDILITMTDLSKAGDTLGYAAKIPEHTGIRFLHNQLLGRVIFKSNEIDNEYIYWLLRTKPYHFYIVASATGSTVKHTSPARIYNYEFEAPIDKRKQQSITAILSSLDDKIEINLQMNQTLETIAQAIFKEWFVNFNFPGFDGQLVDGLPKGWKVGKVSDVCLLNKNTLNTKDTMSIIHYIEISEVSKGVVNNISTYNRGEEPGRARRKLKHGDVVISTVRPNRGSYFLALNPDENLIASTGFAVFSPTLVPFSFLYCFLTNREQINYYGRVADGGAYPAINPSIIMNISVIIPPEEILDLFHILVGSVYERIYANIEENRTLTAIRDGLLPKLMTGKIEVKE